MKHWISLVSSGCGLFAMLASVPADAQTASRVRHIAPAEAEPAKEITLLALVDRAWESTLEIRYRPVGTQDWQGATFTRKDQDQYVATIPETSVMPPGVEYFILSTGDQQVTHFASAERPHRVSVFRSGVEVRRGEYMDKHQNRRANVSLSGEYVDFGARDISNKSILDRYYRINASVGYRVLSFPLKTLRFGYTHLIGDTPHSSLDQPVMCDVGDDVDACTLEAGIKGGGWFELRFILRDGIELDLRGMVMATQEGFNFGSRGEFRVGELHHTHVAVGGEYIADVGASGFARLGWGTVPGFPMAATIEVTNYPASHRDLAVRLIYDIDRPLNNGFRIGARVGYQARDQLIGGVTAGLRSSLDF